VVHSLGFNSAVFFSTFNLFLARGLVKSLKNLHLEFRNAVYTVCICVFVSGACGIWIYNCPLSLVKTNLKILLTRSRSMIEARTKLAIAGVGDSCREKCDTHSELVFSVCHDGHEDHKEWFKHDQCSCSCCCRSPLRRTPRLPCLPCLFCVSYCGSSPISSFTHTSHYDIRTFQRLTVSITLPVCPGCRLCMTHICYDKADTLINKYFSLMLTKSANYGRGITFFFVTSPLRIKI